MRRLLLTQTVLCLLMASCAVHETNTQVPAAPLEDEVFYASLEPYADPDTRVYVDDNVKLHWDAEDRISIFNSTTQNREFRFEGETGANSGSFGPITPEGTGDPLDFKVAVYPCHESTSISSSGVLTLTLPAKQTYVHDSFGPGANAMVSVSENNYLNFKNLGGYLVLKFFGQNVSVSSIKLEGNLGEHLSGLATLSPTIDAIPEVALASGAGTSITLTCETPVALGASQEEPTIFWMVVPPTHFSQGFRLTVTAPDGSVFIKETSRDLTVARNSVLRIAPIEVTTAQPDLVYDIEPVKVRKYLEEIDYTTDTDYTYSALWGSDAGNYYSANLDRPEPAKVTWSGKGASKVLVSTSSSFEGSVFEVSTTSNSTSADIYNLTPGVVYYYKVVKSDGSPIGNVRTLLPEGPLRMIRFASTARNSRDLGGWNAGDKTIRYGKVFRGSQINNIKTYSSDLDLFVNTLGIGYAVDLRGYGSSTGSAFNPFESGQECDWENFPILKLLGIGTGETSELYRLALKRILYYLKEKGTSVYIYCEGGADRTGTVAFLIEALLGVSESDLAKDFELTTYGPSNRRFRHITGIVDYTTYQNESWIKSIYGSSTSWLQKLNTYPYKDMIMYLRNNYQGNTIQDLVTDWATTGENALTLQDIEDLKALLLE